MGCACLAGVCGLTGLVTVLVFRLCIAYVGGLDWFVLDLSFMVVLLVMSLVFRGFDMCCQWFWV